MLTIKRAAFFLSILVALCGGSVSAQQLEQVVEDLADQISESLTSQEKKKVAILPFTDLSGRPTQLGQLLAEELTNQLFLRRGGRFEVVERSKVDAIWQEQELGAEGWVSSEKLGGVGQLVGADAILTGSLAELEDRLRLNARLMAVPSGKLFATASTFMLKTGLGAGMLAPLEDQGGSGASGGKVRPSHSREVKNVTFDLIGCEKQTRLIVCKLIVVNNDVDTILRIYAEYERSPLYDQAGRVFFANLAKIANKEGHDVRTRLITEVPTAVEFHFQGVPSTIEFIKVLSFDTSAGRVEFRDVRF